MTDDEKLTAELAYWRERAEYWRGQAEERPSGLSAEFWFVLGGLVVIAGGLIGRALWP